MFQEELQRWRELNTAEHFVQVAANVHGMSQSFPLLLHHKVGPWLSSELQKVLEALVGKLITACKKLVA